MAGILPVHIETTTVKIINMIFQGFTLSTTIKQNSCIVIHSSVHVIEQYHLYKCELISDMQVPLITGPF